MRIIRILLLALILWNLPSIALFTIGPTMGSLLSYLTMGLLLVYYFIEKKTTPNWWIIILALFYFIISSFQYYGETMYFVKETLKFFVFVFGGYKLVKTVKNDELFYFILIGSISIAIDAIYFPTKFGRYAGVYLNPNEAGFMCIYGYALVFSLKNTSLKLLGQFVFTLMGLLTFSRTFIVIWIILNIISLKISIKNLKIVGIGVLIFSSLLFIDSAVGLNNPRFEQLKNILNNENISTKEISKDSRTVTWSNYYNQILESPIFGNGYGTLSGKTGELGVHNSYLMTIGEAGIIPFALLISYMFYLFYWSVIFFRTNPNLIMQTVALSLFLLTDHNFFTFYHVMFVAMWIQYQIHFNRKELNFRNDHILN